MDSLGDLLGRLTPQEPPEMAALKKYIIDEFDAPSLITLKDDHIIVAVHSAALASTLRLRSRQIQAACRTTKRLVFRIGA